jgi:hypothetical protein
VISWAILAKFIRMCQFESEAITHISGKGIDDSSRGLKQIELCSPATSGVLAVWILSKLLLTLTRFVAVGAVELVAFALLDGLVDRE